ncbi:phosphoribosyltransferase [uncultured Jatrophihabitans sp.]|uniref:phosphoribosyltransferase n=1 Tax=uncultured Jatrophihabitans sp. TaxID=1610747 RepID=UPI0035CB8FAB
MTRPATATCRADDAPAAVWSGRWVADRLGAQLTGDRRLSELVGLGLRRNPRRAHLLVSTVLGKHVPVDPRVVRATGLELGARVVDALDGGTRVVDALDGRDALVLGFAETATGLGHCVAEAMDAPYLHSTRRAVAGVAAAGGFEEEHSHATSHRLLPASPAFLDQGDVLVLVDDELSTGRTALNTIAALHARRPRSRYVVAALVDVRSAADRARLDGAAAELGVRVDVVALAAGELRLPNGFASRAAAVVADRVETASPDGELAGEVVRHPVRWPATTRESGRHGFRPRDVRAARHAAAMVAADLLPKLAGTDVLVLGTEELIYAPLLIATALADLGPTVRVSSTTRSPVAVIDEPGYPIRSGIRFPSSDPGADEQGERHAYNVAGARSDVIVVVDADADTPTLTSGLLAALRPHAQRVHVVPLPTWRPLPTALRGPAFGSYPAEDVGWLLTDLSEAELEAPTEEREEAIQSGGAHYAESLPIEYQPDAEYQALFRRALADSAARVAHAVGVVTELVLAERGPAPVLASLARAGTPVGVLMRRWAAYAHGVDLPHLTLSIVRGRGIDTLALRWLADRHDSADVVFVDGWTGKGAIARELAAAINIANNQLGTTFRADLAVLADPGSCVSTFGTRADFLIPSACLNSTVSGLVSRTVRNSQLLRADQFDGAKFYRALSGVDESARFIEAVVARFADVRPSVEQSWPAVRRSDRRPTWAGWRDVEQLSERHGIGDVTLVKPGVGETTRVLLRRVPWAVLIRPGAEQDLAHVLLLAERRGVPVHEQPGLAYSCVGLIHPRFTRGASGADGTVAAR